MISGALDEAEKVIRFVKLGLALLLLASLAACAFGPQTYYVSSTGNDRNPGTLERPYATTVVSVCWQRWRS